VGHQVVQHGHRLGREGELTSGQQGAAGPTVEHQRPTGQATGRARRWDSGTGAAEHSADAGHQLVGVEGLVEVIVGPLLQTHRPFGRRTHLGEHDDRRPVAGGSQAAADLAAVEPGHQHVQHDQVRVEDFAELSRGVGDTAQGLFPVASHCYGEARPLQKGGQVGCDGLLVVNQQDFGL